jgi:integrase
LSGTSEDCLPFSAEQIVRLRQAADDSGQRLLGDLIELAMWTGGRPDELWQLTVDDVVLPPPGDAAVGIMEIGRGPERRAVPVHRDFVAGLTILCATSADGYVAERPPGADLPGVEAQFDNLTARLGFTGGHGFHAIRRTVETLMRQAGVDDAVIADILGPHGRTAGHPDSTAGIADRQAAIESLVYPIGAFRPRPPR